MAAFNLTAEIQLQAPNTKRVASQIQRDLSGIKINLDIGKNAKNLAAVQQNLGGVAKQGDRASKSFNLLSRNVAEAARRFSVITVATGSFIALARGIKTSIGSAIEFQRELVKISQVTGKSLDQLKGLEQEVTRLSTSLGVANSELLQTSRVLAQAGLSALKTRQALEVLAQTTLAPTFDTIIDTTEGAIAILNQFGREAAKTGQDIKFLEQSLDAINAVSKNFAVESSDLIATVRRTGGVFEAAGGNLKELIALFTSVRQTTREGAETIATGFRTIFTRLQRKDTIEALNELGISLQDAEGKFVGPLKAIEKLAIGLSGLDTKDVRFNEIVEQLGGFRQIGKVIPLIKQFQVTQQALAVANRSVGSTSKDAQEAQKALSVQFAKTRESFDALIRKFTDSSTFQDSAQFVLKLANTFLKFAESLETVLPLLTQFAAIKLGRSLAPGLAQLFGRGSQRRNAGGKILGFNRGGFVPGQGNGDTVPAMLEPGEFVIRKSSAKAIGPSGLQAMNSGGSGVKRAKGGSIPNAQKFAAGGKTGILDTDQIKDKKEAIAIRQAIVDGKKLKQLVWGPAGSGKTTLSRKIYGENFVKSKSDLEKYEDFIVLSGAQTTKKNTKVGGKEVPFSQTTVDLVRAAKSIVGVIPDQETLTARREKRVEMAEETQAGGDTRSVGQLKASRFAANEKESQEILQIFKSFKKKATDISLIKPTQANPEPEAQKLNAGGDVKTYKKSRQFVADINTTYRKPENQEFDQSGSGNKKATRFNASDEFSFTRQKDKLIDVSKIDQRKKGVREYKQAVKANNASGRGLAFEEVASSVFGVNLEKDATNSRLDGTGPGGQRYEIKSLTRAGKTATVADNVLGEKLVGAAIDPITKTDERVKKQFTRQKLTDKKEGDNINLGRISLIQDATNIKELDRVTKKDGTRRKNAAATNPEDRALGGLIQKFAGGGQIPNQDKLIESKTTFTGFKYDLLRKNGQLQVVSGGDVRISGNKRKVMKYWNEIDGKVDAPIMEPNSSRNSLKSGAYQYKAAGGQIPNQDKLIDKLIESKTTFTGFKYDLLRKKGQLQVVSGGDVRISGNKRKVMKYWNEIDGQVDAPIMKSDSSRNSLKSGAYQYKAAGGKIRADQLRVGDVLSSGETVDQKLKTGNRSRRQIQLMLSKGEVSRREKYDLDKMFDLNSRGPDLALKLALGGIATKKKVGAAILDPDQGLAAEGVNVGIKDVKPFITKSTQEQRDGINKEYAAQKYSVVKQGLNQKTSDGFKDTLLDGAAKGVNDAVSSLGSDLGLGSVKPDPNDIGNLKEKIRSSGALGGPFENALNILSNKGKFKPSPANAPFDFPDGLNGAVKDNYNNLPGSYIDAKSSYAAAETEGIKGKIAQEIAAEYKGSATYKNLAADTGSGDKAGLQKALKARFPKRPDQAGYSLSDFQTATGRKYKASELKELGFTKSGGTNYLNSGGSAKGPAPSDTVPAMLTPGEFVFSRKAAESIGYGRLNKMNKKGVEGFATGGAVGPTRFGKPVVKLRGGGAGTAESRGLDAISGGDGNARAIAESLYIDATSEGASVQEGLNIAATQLNDYLQQTSETYAEVIAANKAANDELDKASPEQKKLNAQVKNRAEAEQQVRDIAAKSLRLQRSGLGVQDAYQQATEIVTKEQGKSLKTLEELRKSAIELVSERKAAKNALKRGYSNIDGPEDPRAGTRGGPGGPGPGPDGPDDPDDTSFSTKDLNAEADALSDSLGNVSGVLNQVSSAALGITFVGGTLIESFTGLGEVTKKQAQALLNTISTSVALYAQFISLGLEVASTIAVSSLRKRADVGVAAAATKAAAALSSITPGGPGGEQAGRTGRLVQGAAVVAGIIAIGRTVVDALGAWFIAGQKAIQEGANKLAAKELELVSTGKGGSEEKFVEERKKAAQADLAIQTRTSQDSARKTAGTVGASAAALAATLVAVGTGLQIIPVAGNVLGGAIWLAAAALAGFAAGVVVYETFFATSAARLQENFTLAGNASEGYAITQFRAAKSAQALGTALKEAADAGASTSQQIQILASATDNSVSEYTAGTQRLEKARAEEAKLRKNLIEDGVLTAAGNESASAKGDDDSQDQLKTLDELTKGSEAAAKANLDLIRKSTAEAATFRTLAQKAVSEGLKDISKLGPATLATVSNFSDLAAQTPGLADAFNKAKDKIRELNNIELDQKLDGEKDPAVRAALQAKAAAQTTQSLAELDSESQKLILSEQKLAKAAVLADQAQRQQALTLSRVNKNLSAFNLLLLQSSKLKNVFGSVDDAGATEFGAVQFDTSIFDVTFKQLNDQAIKRINQLGKGTIGKDADGFAKNIRDVKSITKRLPSVFLDFQRDTDGKIIDLPELKKKLTNEIASSIPGGLDGLGGEIRSIIEKNADQAIEGGIKGSLNFEDQKKLQDELEASIESQIAVFKRAVELQNQFLGKLAQINSKIVAAQEGVINAQTKISDVIERNADRLANASEKPRSRQEKEKGRTRTANLALGPAARDAGARAGDVTATAKAFKNLNKEAERLRKEQRKLIESGNAKIKVDSDNSIKSANLGKAANDAAKGAARAKAELERLADQSARAADVEKDLTKLREKRSEAESLQENIAFGSDDQRQEIFKGFRLLNQAFTQGGIQGANSEQRALISSTLDSVGSQQVNFEGQQVTGKELKQIFAARETGRLGLGGLNQFIEDLRKAENPLLGELKEIARSELTASIALTAIATQELTTLKSIDTTLKAAFQEELEKAQDQAQTELGGDEGSQQVSIDKNAENLLGLTTKIADQTAAVAKQTKLMTELSNQTLKAIESLDVAQAAKRDKQETAIGRSKGGPAYFNRGGVVPGSAPTPKGMEEVFKPKGTDTVPAMLQKGEFVIKKSSVDKIGKDNLQQMNNGGAVYLDDGGDADEEKKKLARDKSVGAAALAQDRGQSDRWSRASRNAPLPSSPKRAVRDGATLGQASDDAYAAAEARQRQEIRDIEAEESKKQKPNFEKFYQNINLDIIEGQDEYVKFRKQYQDPPLTIKEARGDYIQRAAKNGLGRPPERSLAAYKNAVKAGEIKDDTALASNFMRYGKNQPFRGNFDAQVPPPFALTAKKILELRNKKQQAEAQEKKDQEKLDKIEKNRAAYGQYKTARDAGSKPDSIAFGVDEKYRSNIEKYSSRYEKIYQNELSKEAENKRKQAADKRAKRVADAGGGAVGEATVKAEDRAKQAKKEADARKKEQNKARAEYEAYNSPEAKQARKDEATAKARQAEEDARIKSKEAMEANAKRLKDKQDSDAAKKEQTDQIRNAEKQAYVAAFTADIGEGTSEYAQAVKQAEQEWLKGKKEDARKRNDARKAAVQARDKGEPNLNTSAGRKRARLAGTKSDIQTKEEEQVKAVEGMAKPDPVEAGKRQKYNSLLRRNGPKIAAKYAKTAGLDVAGKANNNNGKQFSDEQRSRVASLFKLLKGFGIKDPSAFLDALGGAQNLNQGGTVDSIPAMLTEGEYVVNPKAAKKIGMKNLEKMNATGETPARFAKGGVVGGSKTSYLQDGGTGNGSMGPLEINIGPFSEVLNKFSAAFGSKLDNMVGQFKDVAGAMNNLAQSIGQGMKVTHSFNGDMTMTFSMSDEQTTNIVNAVGDAITPKMEEIIKREVDQRFNKNSFKSGG